MARHRHLKRKELPDKVLPGSSVEDLWRMLLMSGFSPAERQAIATSFAAFVPFQPMSCSVFPHSVLMSALAWSRVPERFWILAASARLVQDDWTQGMMIWLPAQWGAFQEEASRHQWRTLHRFARTMNYFSQGELPAWLMGKSPP